MVNSSILSDGLFLIVTFGPINRKKNLCFLGHESTQNGYDDIMTRFVFLYGGGVKEEERKIYSKDVCE